MELDQEQIDVLEELGLDVDSLCEIKGTRLHPQVIHNNGFTDGEHLVFFDDLRGGGDADHKRFIYYMGAERESVLLAKWQGVTVYGEISPDRLERYTDRDESEEAEGEESSQDG